MRMMKMTDWTWKHWGILTAGWFLITFGVFFLSEKFKDVDAVIYPCVFILIFSMLIGPGMIGAMLPLPKTQDGAKLRSIAPFISYVVCFLVMRGLSLLCFRMGIL